MVYSARVRGLQPALVATGVVQATLCGSGAAACKRCVGFEVVLYVFVCACWRLSSPYLAHHPGLCTCRLQEGPSIANQARVRQGHMQPCQQIQPSVRAVACAGGPWGRLQGGGELQLLPGSDLSSARELLLTYPSSRCTPTQARGAGAPARDEHCPSALHACMPVHHPDRSAPSITLPPHHGAITAPC
jgi:hypothetical protein